MTIRFEEMEIADDFLTVLRESGIDEPTAVQQSAIPVVSEGRDVVIRSHTGTGKTLAYLLPIMQKIDVENDVIQAIIIAPTQELAMQIVREAEKLGQARQIRALGLIGGASLKRQIERLKDRPHLVAGTPGRLLELLELRKLKVHQTKVVVTDEVDQVFQLGEHGAVEQILNRTLRDRQLVFVSATIPQQLEEVIERWMVDPVHIDETGDEVMSPAIEHVYFTCQPRKRTDLAVRLVRHYAPRAALIFVSNTEMIAEVTEKLKYNGIEADALYGDQPKIERTNVLDRLRNGQIRVLVATDVAARGLDIPHLSHVFSYNPAPDADAYVHRAGRTGRMGRRGISATIVTEQELFIIRKFEKQLGIQIHAKELYFGRIVNPDKKKIMKASQVRKSAGSATTRVPTANAGATANANGKPAASASGVKSSAPKTSAAKAPAAKSPATKSPAAITPAATRPAKAKKRKADRKNKGAPRWLKEKMKQQ